MILAPSTKSPSIQVTPTRHVTARVVGVYAGTSGSRVELEGRVLVHYIDPLSQTFVKLKELIARDVTGHPLVRMGLQGRYSPNIVSVEDATPPPLDPQLQII